MIFRHAIILSTSPLPFIRGLPDFKLRQSTFRISTIKQPNELCPSDAVMYYTSLIDSIRSPSARVCKELVPSVRNTSSAKQSPESSAESQMEM